MSAVSRQLRCNGCQKDFSQLLPFGCTVVPSGIRCPKCGSASVKLAGHAREATHAVEEHAQRRTHWDTGNLFEVLAVGDGGIQFRSSPAGLFEGLPWAQAQIQVPRELALNLAAWLALLADPTGKEFERIGEEIKNR